MVVSLVITAGWLALRAGLDTAAVSKLFCTGRECQTADRSRAALIVAEVSGSGDSGLALEVGVRTRRGGGRVRETKMRIWRKEILGQGGKVRIEFTGRVTCF